MAELLYLDLGFVARYWGEPCYDLWEEALGHHYHTRIVQLAALRRGAAWAEEVGDHDGSHEYRAISDRLYRCLDALWSPADKIYRCRAGVASAEALDIAVVLGVVHAGLCEGRHSLLDDRVHSTLRRLEALFESEFAINRSRQGGLGPAMGRYKGDRYYGGGAYYVASLGVAEFYYGLAGAVGAGARLRVTRHNRELLRDPLGAEGRASTACGPLDGLEGAPAAAAMATALIRRGDMMMATIRKYTPPTGELSEQFDRGTGEQTSAKDLAWSYAAFITALDARRRATAC